MILEYFVSINMIPTYTSVFVFSLMLSSDAFQWSVLNW